MSFIKKPKPQLRYKKILNLKQNVQNKSKLLNFKAKKWQNLVLNNKKNHKTKYKIKNIDQLNYFIPKFTDFFSNKFKSNLQSKQKISYFYGVLTNKYLKKLISKIVTKENSSYCLLKNLEMRLDSILYRAHFVNSFRDARQLISHGHVFVNNVQVKNHSFILVDGDVVSVSKDIHPLIQKNVFKSFLLPIPPKYLQINYKIFFIVYLGNLEKNKLFNQFNFWLDLKTIIDFK
nr:ribosomal protein S4 [Lithodesmioides sp. mgcode 4]